MSYEKQTWVDNDPATPLSAARLTHMEEGIAAAQNTEQPAPTSPPVETIEIASDDGSGSLVIYKTGNVWMLTGAVSAESTTFPHVGKAIDWNKSGGVLYAMGVGGDNAPVALEIMPSGDSITIGKRTEGTVYLSHTVVV